MRKLFYTMALLLAGQFCFGQAVQDNATIPVSVTLNSILRLNVTSGGNIQFVFNTMDQYANGIANTPGTTTTFTVASSRDYNVTMGAEDATLNGVETGGNIPLTVIQYEMSTAGTGTVTPSGSTLALVQVTAPATIVAQSAGAGGVDHTYQILWEAGTVTSVLDNPADVYVTNVFLNLQPQ
ncbi:MAG: hypothetical protein AB7S48_15125 [Bacteroidales bacterium]